MKEKWESITDFDNYSVSNKGRVKNDDTQHYLKLWSPPKSTLLYCTLFQNGKSHNKPVHKLVAQHFDKMKPEDETALHLNYIQYDNREPNLEGCTRGKAIVRTRKNNRLKAGKIKGIYSWKIGNKKFRAVLALEDGKMGTKTLGYFETYEEAKEVYHKAYKKKFGYEPFKLI